MKFNSPFSFSLLGLIPVLILLYMLKIKRNNYYVSALKFWEKIAQDIQVQKPWQKLIISTLLILQILAVVLFIIAIAKPVISGAREERDAVIIIDNSLSMEATDIKPSRLDEAKRQAISVIGKLAKNSRVSLIAVSGNTDVLFLSSDSHDEIKKKIEDLRAFGSKTDLANGLLLADAITKSSKNCDIYLFSDGGGLPYLEVENPVKFSKIGDKTDNLLVNAVSYQSTKGSPDKAELFVSVANNGDAKKTSLISVYDQKGNLLDAREVNIPAKKLANTSFYSLDASNNELQVKIKADDFLESDNEAWVVKKKPISPAVKIYTKGNRFLENAFKSIFAKVSVSSTFSGLKKRGSENELLVFDGVDARNIPNSSNVLFINPPSGNQYFSVTGESKANNAASFDASSKLLSGVDFKHVNIYKSRSIEVPDWGDAVVQGIKSPLIISGEKNSLKFVVLAFDIHDSDFALNYSFPIFFSNLVEHLFAGSEEESQYLAGETLKLPSGVESISVKTPSGEKEIFQEGKKTNYYDFKERGIYEFIFKKKDMAASSRQIVTSMIGSQESDIEPTDLKIISKTEKKNKALKAVETEVDVYKPFLILLLTLLVIEWYVYLRN